MLSMGDTGALVVKGAQPRDELGMDYRWGRWHGVCITAAEEWRVDVTNTT